MKKSVKRVLCAALACSLSCTLFAGHLLRFDADGETETTTALSAALENVTERFDPSALRKQNFNSQVLKTKDTSTYETSTVIVTPSGGNAVTTTTEFTPESGALTLKDEGAILTLDDSYVIVDYTKNGKMKSARVVITVNKREPSSIEQYPEEAKVMRNVLIYGGVAMMLVGGLGVFAMLASKKRKLAKVAVAVSALEPSDLGEATQTLDTEAKSEKVAATDEEKPQE